MTSGMIALIICVNTSMMVNSTLVEITINIVFAYVSLYKSVVFLLYFIQYFGLSFITISSLIMMRVQALPDDPKMKSRKPFLYIFTGMIFVSGFFCFLLEDQWFMKINPIEKIPIYTMIAISLNFCLLFSLIDVINLLINCCASSP